MPASGRRLESTIPLDRPAMGQELMVNKSSVRAVCVVPPAKFARSFGKACADRGNGGVSPGDDPAVGPRRPQQSLRTDGVGESLPLPEDAQVTGIGPLSSGIATNVLIRYRCDSLR